MKQLPPFHQRTPAEVWATLNNHTSALAGIDFSELLPYRLWYELNHAHTYARTPALRQELATILLNWTERDWPNYVCTSQTSRCRQLHTFTDSSAERITPAILHHMEAHLALARMAHGWAGRSAGAQLDELWRGRGNGELLAVPSAQAFQNLELCA